MAENNSSAPLKTAGEPFVALGECIADQVCLSVAELPDRDSPADWPQAMLVTSDELRNIVLNAINYAAQAVAAQAAPAAVAVPPSIPGLSGDAALAYEQCRAVVHLALAVADVYSSNALIVASDSRLADQIGAASAEVMEYLGDTLNSSDATTEEDEWLEPIFESAQKRWPATEDSSAGDLAEHSSGPALDGGTPGPWRIRKRERDGELLDCFVEAPDCQGLPYAAEIMGDDEYREDLARKLADCELIVRAVNALRAGTAQTEVQAEPVADWLPYSRRVALAARHGQKVTGPFNALVRDVIATYLDTHGATAPQAQPADALDAARYRHLRDGVMVDGEINEALYVRVDQASYPNRWALVGQELDAAIDAAMAAAQEGGNA